MSRTLARRIWLSSDFTVFCIVSVEDFTWLIEKMWNCGRGGKSHKHVHYAKRNVGVARSPIWMHRAIMRRADPRTETFEVIHRVDHGNRQTLDNRRCNLSWVTDAENRLNQGNCKRLRNVLVPSVQWIWENECEDVSAPVEMPF